MRSMDFYSKAVSRKGQKLIRLATDEEVAAWQEENPMYNFDGDTVYDLPTDIGSKISSR